MSPVFTRGDYEALPNLWERTQPITYASRRALWITAALRGAEMSLQSRRALSPAVGNHGYFLPGVISLCKQALLTNQLPWLLSTLLSHHKQGRGT